MIYDNGQMRDPSSEESSQINTKIGGGSSRFELIASGSLENTSRKAIQVEGYDEFYITFDNLTGNGTFLVQLQVASTTTTTTTRLNDFLSNTAKFVKSYVQRLSPTDFLNVYNGTSINTALAILPLASPEGITYDNKVVKVTIATSTGGNIASGNYNIYGRNLINEQGI